MMDIRKAAANLLRLEDAHRDAVNGLGHPGESHDDLLGGSSIHDACANCGGAQYGIEDEMNTAWGDLRVLLGQERKPWER